MDKRVENKQKNDKKMNQRMNYLHAYNEKRDYLQKALTSDSSSKR